MSYNARDVDEESWAASTGAEEYLLICPNHDCKGAERSEDDPEEVLLHAWDAVQYCAYRGSRDEPAEYEVRYPDCSECGEPGLEPDDSEVAGYGTTRS